MNVQVREQMQGQMCETLTVFGRRRALGILWLRMTKDWADHRSRLSSAPWWAIKGRRIQCDTGNAEKLRRGDGRRW